MECGLIMTTQVYSGYISYLSTKGKNWNSYFGYDDIEISNITISNDGIDFIVTVDTQILNTNNSLIFYLQIDGDTAQITNTYIGSTLMDIHLDFPYGLTAGSLKNKAFSILIRPNINHATHDDFVFKCFPITIDVCGIGNYQGNRDILINTTVTDSNYTDVLGDFTDITYTFRIDDSSSTQTAKWDINHPNLMFFPAVLGEESYMLEIRYTAPSSSQYLVTTVPFTMYFNGFLVTENPLLLESTFVYQSYQRHTVNIILPEVYTGEIARGLLDKYNIKGFFTTPESNDLQYLFDPQHCILVDYDDLDIAPKTVYSDADTEFEKMDATLVSFQYFPKNSFSAAGFAMSVSPKDDDHVYPTTYMVAGNNSPETGFSVDEDSHVFKNTKITDSPILKFSIDNLPLFSLQYTCKDEVSIVQDNVIVYNFNQISTSASPEQLALYFTYPDSNNEIFTDYYTDIVQSQKQLKNSLTIHQLRSLVPDLPVGTPTSLHLGYNIALKLGDSAWIIPNEDYTQQIIILYYAIKQLALEITYAKDFVDGAYAYETKTYDYSNTAIKREPDTLICKQNRITVNLLADDYVKNIPEFSVRVDYQRSSGFTGFFINPENQNITETTNFSTIEITGSLDRNAVNDSKSFIPLHTARVPVEFSFRTLQKPEISVTDGDNVSIPSILITTTESEFDVESTTVTIETDRYRWSNQFSGETDVVRFLPIDLFEDNHITVTQYTNDATGLSSEPATVTWNNHTADKRKMVVSNPILVFYDPESKDIVPAILQKDPDINTTVAYPSNQTIQQFNSDYPFVLHNDYKEIKTSIAFTVIKGLHKYYITPSPSVGDGASFCYTEVLPEFLEYFRDAYHEYIVMVARPDHYTLFGRIIDSSLTRSTDNSYTIKMTHLVTEDTDNLKKIGVALKNG